jgi:hypothetical protein
MDEGFTTQLNYAIDTLLSPAGGFALLAGLMLLISLFFSPKIKWLVLTGAIWISTLAFFLTPGKMPIHMAFPLEQLRNNGRSIAAGLLIALLIPAVTSPRGWRIRRVGIPVVLFFVFELVLTTRMILAGVVDRGLLSLIIYPLLFLSLGWGLSKWVQTVEDAHRALRAVMFAGVLFVAGSSYQFAINRTTVLSGMRFQGTTGNPQSAGMLIALTLPASLYFVGRSSEIKINRVMSGVAAGFMAILLLWTGSRTGILMAATGIAITFRSRIGKFLGVLIFVGVFVFLALQVYDDATTSMVGMLARGDTRTRIWTAMWQDFLANPAMGSMQGGFGVGENSYLSTASSAGLFGLIPLFAFVAATTFACLKLNFSRRLLGQEKPLADAVLGGLISVLVGGIFEGHLLGTLTISVFVIYIMCVLLAFLLDVVDVERQQRLIGADAGAGQEYGDDDMLPGGALAHQPVAESYF